MKKIFFILLLLQNVFAKILVQGAMLEEIDILLEELKDKQEVQIGAYVFYTGKIGEEDVIVSRTLIGLSNAAAASAIGITHFKPTLIINQGTAGAHNTNLNVGDIVIGSKIYNVGAYYTEYSTKEINQDLKKPMKAVLRLLDSNAKDQENYYFSSDEKLVQKIYEYSKNTNYFVKADGVIASADAYNKETKLIEWIRKTYNSDAEEMESVAAAQIAKAFNIPFLSVRIISNIEPKQISYDSNTAKECQKFIIGFLKNINK